MISTLLTVKTNKPCRFTISFESSTLFQKLVYKAVKEKNVNMKVYYIIPLNYQLAGHFQEKISPLYKLILKFVSPLHFIYVCSEITNFQKELFFKGHSCGRRFSILFSILSIVVFMISYFQI